MNKLLVSVLLASACLAVQAGVVGSVTCGNAPVGVYNNGQLPVVNVLYSTGSDAGLPGLFALGVMLPDKTNGSVLTKNGWELYKGGLYPFLYRYDNGLPASIPVSVPFPDGLLTTAAYVGYDVGVGHGAYTADARLKVADRRQALNSAKELLVAKGRWSSVYDDDLQYIWSLVQKDAVDNQKYLKALTVPLIDCTLPEFSWGGGHH